MADSNFEKFKSRYKSGKIKTLANPPPMPGPSGAAKSIAAKAAKAASGAMKKWAPMAAGTAAVAGGVEYLDKGASQVRARLRVNDKKTATDKSRLNKGQK